MSQVQLNRIHESVVTSQGPQVVQVDNLGNVYVCGIKHTPKDWETLIAATQRTIAKIKKAQGEKP